MNETMLAAKVMGDFQTRFRTAAATKGQNMSDYLRDLVARHLGFSSYADYLHIVEGNLTQQNEDGVPTYDNN